jgi:hypothetical protein
METASNRRGEEDDPTLGAQSITSMWFTDSNLRVEYAGVASDEKRALHEMFPERGLIQRQ